MLPISEEGMSKLLWLFYQVKVIEILDPFFIEQTCVKIQFRTFNENKVTFKSCPLDAACRSSDSCTGMTKLNPPVYRNIN